jgi:hypothetical protein
MATSEERLKVLKMVQEGKLNADQASELLSFLETSTGRETGRTTQPPPPPGVRGNRWLRVRVTDTNTGKTRVNIRLPVSMVSAGIKMGMRFTPEVQGLDPEELAQIIASGETGQIVDVMDDEDGEHVEVFVE